MAIALGLGIEVVSEYELAGAVEAGVPVSRILVNGVGKHHFLSRCTLHGLAVHFDSVAEVRALARLAKKLSWCVGLRYAIPAPDGDQFGMTDAELRSAATLLANEGVAISGVHFHLHTNLHRVDEYRGALEHAARAIAGAQLSPEYLDVGGGLPIFGEIPLDGPAAATSFDFGEFGQFLESIPATLPSLREVWLENGRFLTGSAGALVITVLDRKDRGNSTYLICDGGRVNHARMASIETHDILLVPERKDRLRETIVCGPTCSAIDRLGCWMLPESVAPGDKVIWLNAGAYHIPLETRFSTGLAPVVWFNEWQEPEVIRARETPVEWWSQWI